MTFAETRFPTDIAYGSSGGPEYATDIVTTQSGHEQRNINWQDARARYNVAHGVKTKGQLAALIAFFRARKGRAHGFRFKDWTDYQGIAEPIGIGDGAKTVFQLTRSYANGGVNEARIITKPVSGTVKLYANGVQQMGGFGIDHATGAVTFTAAPANAVAITADFEFDVPVRFDTDRLSASLDAYGSHSWQDIPLIEIRM